MIDYRSRSVSADEAVSLVKSSNNVFIHGASATPTPLVEALSRRRDLNQVKLYHLHTCGAAPFATAEAHDHFRSISFFVGPALREPVNAGQADFIPVFLSDIPDLFASGTVSLDVAILQLSPPDRHGFCTLGTSCDAARSAADHAKIIIAEINEQMPRTHGHTVVPLSRVSSFICTDRIPHEHAASKMSDVENRIGAIIADLIPDRACLQLGIGAIPDAVLTRLRNKTDLGIHTEMFSDGVVDLFESGAITNKYKSVHAGRLVTSFVTGSKKLFDFVHDNPLVEFHPCDRTNDTALIRKNERAVAINSAIQVDLSGQVCADSFGHSIYSGIGGQMDFVRGAAVSRGGLPIIALPSTAKSGTISRITTELTPGSGVVTTRGHVHWIATEYGAVNLHGKSLRERASMLISIAHPDFREELKRSIRNIRHFIV